MRPMYLRLGFRVRVYKRIENEWKSVQVLTKVERQTCVCVGKKKEKRCRKGHSQRVFMLASVCDCLHSPLEITVAAVQNLK